MKADFKAPIAEFAKLLNLTQATVVRVIAADLWKMIIERTPVDTGRARASWGLSEGAPISTTPPEGTYSGVSTSVNPTAWAGITGVKPVFIVSNLEYIEPLENGHSQRQAPAGMVRISIAEVSARITLLVKKAAAEAAAS